MKKGYLGLNDEICCSAGQIEVHNQSSLSRRVGMSRETVAGLLADGGLKYLTRTETSPGNFSYAFSAAVLDETRNKVVTALERRINAMAIPEPQRQIVRMHAHRELHNQKS